MRKQKVVFEDAGNCKVAFGYIVEEDDTFIKLQDQIKGTIRINKRFIVSIKEME